ncbi:glutamate receptor 4 [Lingula anatina]|uniref:Glutamate receptor 4 n=1 Tax=Lingula anatina TaxID=7574 RepID=A0A1S3KF06_LINAN|nr:glutamate receptor 4 [Lingula anatina]|eukprot:XP_013421039.1 glutamate receptor 4 [Lingula anatina]
MYHVVGAINNAGAYVVIHFKYVTNVTDALAKLAAMDKTGSEKKHNVIIDMSLNDTNTVLKRRFTETPQTKLLYNYLIARLFTNEIDFKAFPAGGMNITGFHMVDYDTDVTVKKYNQVYRRCDLKCGSFDNTCPTSNGAAFAADSLTVFIKAMDLLHKNGSSNFPTNNPYPKNSGGLACAEWPNAPKPWIYGEKLIGALKKVELDGLTGKILFDEDGYRINFTLYLFGTTSQEGPAKLGTWESHPRRLNRPRLNLIHDTKSVGLLNVDPDNKTYIVTTILRDPYMMEKIHPRPDGGNWTGNDRYEGFCKDIIDQLMRDLNMNYELRVVADGSHGSKQKGNVTHPWNGMVWELMTERADMAIGDLTISAEREKVIDFTKPFMNLGISIMIRKTPGSQFDITDMFIFMVPLSKEIWMCIAFAYLGVSVVLFLVSRFSPAEWLINDPMEDDGKKKTCVRNDFGIYNSLWFALAAFMQQGCEICPRSVSGRIVGSVWWFFTLIVISSYTANLAAFLTTSRMISPIGSAEDLAAQTEISYATSREGTSRDFFRESKISTYERMWAYMSSRPHNFPKNNAEGVRRVRDENDKFAFLMESTSIDYHSNREDCTTTRVGDLLNSRSYGIGMPKGFSKKNVVTLQLLTLVESAFVEERRKYWWEEDSSRRGLCKDRQDTNKKGEDTSSSLSISKIAGIFIILLCGMMMGIIISILELFYKTKIDAFRKHVSI